MVQPDSVGDPQEESHDPEQGSHDAQGESRDTIQGSHDAQEESHDPEQGLHDTREESHDPDQRSHDTLEESYDPEKGSHDIQEESHDPVQGSHDLQDGTIQEGSYDTQLDKERSAECYHGYCTLPCYKLDHCQLKKKWLLWRPLSIIFMCQMMIVLVYLLFVY